MAPGDVRRLHQVVSKRANEWSVIDGDPRTQDPKLSVGSAQCECYQNGRSKFGNECNYQRASTRNENTRGTLSAGKGFAKNRCQLCNKITDPPHVGSDVLQSTCSVEDARSVIIIFIRNCSTAHIKVISADTNPGYQRYGTDCHSRGACKNMPVKFSTNIIRVHGNLHEPQS